MALLGFVIVGQRAVEGIQPRSEIHWHIVAAKGGIRVVHAAVIFSPFCVPRTTRSALGYSRTVSRQSRNSGHDVAFPRVTLSRLEFCGQLSRREASELISSKGSSAVFSDFLLNFVFAGSAFEAPPCAKSDAMDESRTAIA